LAVALAAAGCAPDCSRAPGEARPNVVLVTIDTLRADHLGAYGSTTVATPNLDRLAGDGLVFERAYSASDVTIPSHLSLLSSLPVVEHGVVDLASPVARPAQLLPELFQAAGYRTAAFVSAVHLGPTRALGQLVAPGVSRFEVPRRESKPYRAAETNDRLFPWLRGNCRTPFFVWVHYWDPHMPYTPEPPWDTAYYQDDPYALRHTSMSGVQLVWFAYDLDHFRRHLARDAGHVRALKRDLGASSRQVKDLVLYPNLLDRYTSDAATRAALRARIHEIATRIRPGVPFRRLHADWLTGVRDVRFPLARYAGEVSSTDAEIGRLRAELTRLGISDRTIVVLTADHGESLGEHGIWFEHLGVHDPVVHVPLLVSAPGRVAPGRRPDPVSSLDVAPTVLGLAGLSVPPSMRGRDLLRDAKGSPLVVSEAVRREQVAVVQGRWKLVRTERSLSYTDAYERQAGTVELFDVETDATEVHDLAAEEPGRVAELRAALDAWLDVHRAPPPPSVPAGKRDTLDDLRALGRIE
jgi:arylsulfatase